MIAEQELWACAHLLLQQHGANAPAFIAERIGALAIKGDLEGVETWKQIAHRMDQLMTQPGSPN